MTMNTRPNLLTMAISVMLVAAGVTRAPASVLFDSNGFEAPAYTTTYLPAGPPPGSYPGQLENQPAADPLFFHQAGPNINTATVEDTVFLTGSQGVRLDHTGLEDTRWGVPTPATPTSVTVSWNMLVVPSTGIPFSGPLFGVETYALPGGGFSVLGALAVDPNTSAVMAQFPGGAGFLPVSAVVPGTWNSYSFVLDYVTHTYTAFVNNFQVGPVLPFVDGPFNTFNDADLSGLQDPNGPDVAGTAFFDNFSVSAEGSVPEPTSLLVWGLGALLATGAYRARLASRSRPLLIDG